MSKITTTTRATNENNWMIMTATRSLPRHTSVEEGRPHPCRHPHSHPHQNHHHPLATYETQQHLHRPHIQTLLRSDPPPPRATPSPETTPITTIDRRPASRPTNRPLTPLLPHLHRDPHLYTFTNIDTNPALTTLLNGKRCDDRFPSGVDALELEEGTGFGADDFDLFDGTETGGEGLAEGLVRDVFLDALLVLSKKKQTTTSQRHISKRLSRIRHTFTKH